MGKLEVDVYEAKIVKFQTDTKDSSWKGIMEQLRFYAFVRLITFLKESMGFTSIKRDYDISPGTENTLDHYIYANESEAAVIEHILRRLPAVFEAAHTEGLNILDEMSMEFQKSHTKDVGIRFYLKDKNGWEYAEFVWNEGDKNG